MVNILSLNIIYTCSSLLVISNFNTAVGRPEDCYQSNTVYNNGHYVAERNLPELAECQQWCQKSNICTHFSYYHSSQTCFLRTGNKAETKAGVTSGPKLCVSPTVDVVTPKCTGNVCLQGGRYDSEGDLIVSGRPVCDDSWGLREGYVACRELGYPGVSQVTVASEYGTTASNYSMDDVHCIGNETSISKCFHKQADNCGAGEAAGVVCTSLKLDIPDKCRKGKELCIIGGPQGGTGNLYYGGHPVCHNGWDILDALVACRSMGYLGAKNATIESRYGPAASFFTMSNVKCLGHEKSLGECWHDAGRIEGCEQGSVAGIVCLPQAEELKPETFDHSALIIVGQVFGMLLLLVCCLGLIPLVLYAKSYHLRRKGADSEDRTDLLRFRNPLHGLQVSDPQEAITPIYTVPIHGLVAGDVVDEN